MALCSEIFIFLTGRSGSRATRSSSRYNLADLNDVISGATAIVKKAKVPLQIPKAPIPAPVNTSGSGIKKRKGLEILDLTVDDLEPSEVMKKLATMVETVSIDVLISMFMNSDIWSFLLYLRLPIRFRGT